MAVGTCNISPEGDVISIAVIMVTQLYLTAG